MSINIQRPCFVPRALHTDHPYVQYRQYEMVNFAANFFHIDTPAARSLAKSVGSQAKYLIVDPRTPIYQYGGHAGKPTFEKLEYAISAGRVLEPKEFDSKFTSLYTRKVLAEQRQHNTTVLVPPYFHFNHENDPWFKINVACLTEAGKQRQSTENLLMFLLFDCSLLLRSKSVAAIAQVLEQSLADGYYLLAADLNSTNLTSTMVKGYQQLVERLAVKGLPVIPAQAGKMGLALVGSGSAGYAMGFGKLDSIALETFRQGGTGAGQPNRYYFHNLLLPVYARNADDVAKAQATSPAYPCNCPHCSGRLPSQVRSKDKVLHYVDFRLRELDDLRGMNTQQASNRLAALFSAAFGLSVATQQELQQHRPFASNILPTSEFAHLDTIAQCLA